MIDHPADGVPPRGVERSSIAAAWANYERLTLDPINAGQIQRRETRMAWYCGIAWLFDVLTRTMDPCTEPTANDLDYISDLNEELGQYTNKLKRGDT
jgi:hypothetical protein